MANRSIGKNLLRVSTMLLAVLMLVLTTFTGITPTVSAETSSAINVLRVKTSAATFCGQNVVLEAGKTYAYSYYYASGKFSGGILLDGNDNEGVGGATITVTKTIYDEAYNKVTYEFVAPENATPAEEEGKVKVYLGIQPKTDGASYYFYGFDVHAVEDETKTNLFNDPYFTEENSLRTAEGTIGNWYKPWTPVDSTLNTERFYVESFEALGGMDYFVKTDADRYVVKMAAGGEMKNAWFGQFVSLEKGKTYVFSNYYTGGEMVHIVRNNVNYTYVSADLVNYDKETNKKTTIFTVPEDAPDQLWIGLQCPSNTEAYYYDLRLYDIDNPEVNLLKDYNLMSGGTGIDGSVWRKPSSSLQAGYYSKTNLKEAGGMDIFKKADVQYYAVKLESGTSGQPFFGQRVLLEAGETYVFSNYFLPGTDPIQKICYPDSTELATEGIYNADWSVQGVKFTVPADAPKEENGKVLIFVGFRGHNSANPLYYYGLRLYKEKYPEYNLLSDPYLEGGSETAVKYDTWRTPGGNQLSNKYSKVTLESIGGIDVFKKSDAERYVLKLAAGSAMSNAWFGQDISLEKGKTYVFTNYYTGGEMNHVIRNKDTGNDISADFSTYENEYFKKTTVFTIPEDGPDLIWVGLQCPNNDTEPYYYDLRLYAYDNPEENLFKDFALIEGTSTTVNGNVWKKPSSGLQSGYFSKTTLAAAGGMDIFKKTDADRYAVKLNAGTSGQPYFGQNVSLEAGKTYVFSNYFLPGISANQKVCYANLTELSTETITYGDWSKQGVKFTVPADAPDDGNGKKLIFVGFRGNKANDALYYYDLELYDVEHPEINLLKDPIFAGGSETAVKYDTWKNPSGTPISNAYSKVSLASIGSVNLFMAFEKKCDATLDGKIDIRDLVRIKRYSVGTVDSLPEARGDLDSDGTVATASDLVILRKEILK